MYTLHLTSKTPNRFSILVIVVALLGVPQAISAQTQSGRASPLQMRSRLLTSLTGYEVEEYLKRNDVIFVPVGPTEVNGGNPVDVEYVIPLAYAIKLAEKSDGLVLPYLAYFYPGGTVVGRGTVEVSTSEGLPYLKTLTRSLIRQGFRRIIFLTSHGPSGNTLLPLVREIFDETHVPVVWMDVGVIGTAARKSSATAGAGQPPPAANQAGSAALAVPALPERRLITYGAFLAVGRLNDMPVGLSQPQHDVVHDPSLEKLNSLVGSGSPPSGSFYADPSEHGGWVTPVTVEQREQWGKEGLALIDAQVAGYDVAGMLDALRHHDEFTKELEKKYGEVLPKGAK